MRWIEHTTKFRRDYKRELKGRYKTVIEIRLNSIVRRLANDLPLDRRYRDHALIGNWKDHRDCHVAPDLVPINRFTDDNGLQLVRLGSHSELGLK